MTFLRTEAPAERYGSYLDQHIDHLVQQTGTVNPVDAAIGRNGAEIPPAGYVLQTRILEGGAAQFTWHAYNEGMLRLSDPEDNYTEDAASSRTKAVWMDLEPGHAKVSLAYTPGEPLVTRVPFERPASEKYGTRLLLGQSPVASTHAHYMALLAPDIEAVGKVIGIWGDALGITGERKKLFVLDNLLQIATLYTGEKIPPPPRPTLAALMLNFLRN